MRYVAKRGNLWGSTPEEAAFIDMVAEGIKDARGIVVSYPFTPEKAGLHLLALLLLADCEDIWWFPKFGIPCWGPYDKYWGGGGGPLLSSTPHL